MPLARRIDWSFASHGPPFSTTLLDLNHGDRILLHARYGDIDNGPEARLVKRQRLPVRASKQIDIKRPHTCSGNSETAVETGSPHFVHPTGSTTRSIKHCTSSQPPFVVLKTGYTSFVQLVRGDLVFTREFCLASA